MADSGVISLRMDVLLGGYDVSLGLGRKKKSIHSHRLQIFVAVLLGLKTRRR